MTFGKFYLNRIEKQSSMNLWVKKYELLKREEGKSK